MQIQKVGTRGTVFSFYDDFIGDTTNVYVINGTNSIFLCDTFLGPASMAKIQHHLSAESTSKPVVLFNSHSDWDHIWGNCYFKSSLILSHVSCLEKIAEEGEKILEELKAHQQGEVRIVLPNLVFQDKIWFPGEHVEFFYTSGHTKGSASCFDRLDNILFVGDNVESPLPYINELNFTDYIKTLQKYLDMEANVIIPGHGNILFEQNLIRQNHDYIERFSRLDVNTSEFTRKHILVHLQNLQTVGKKYKARGQNQEAIKYFQELIQIAEKIELPNKDESLKNTQMEINELTK